MYVEKYLCKNVKEYIKTESEKKKVKWVKNVCRKVC